MWKATFRRLVGQLSPPRPSTHRAPVAGVGGLLLASTGEAFHPEVIERAIALSAQYGPTVHVLSTARIWGTALGLQHPGLYPSKREWAEQADIVTQAVEALSSRGIDARPRVTATRNPSRVIAREAERLGCQAIVMGVRPLSQWARIIQQDEASRVQRRTRIPVHLVPLGAVSTVRE